MQHSDTTIYTGIPPTPTFKCAPLPSEDKDMASEHGSVAPLQVVFQFEANAILWTKDL